MALGKIVAFVGHKGSGKDTAAQAFIDQGWVRVAFADPLKDMAMRIKGVWMPVPDRVRREHPLAAFMTYQDIIAALGMDTAKNVIPDVRLYLQTLGTEGVRETLGDDSWATLSIATIMEHIVRGENVVVTDVRYHEEFNALVELGARIVGIIRDDAGDGDIHAPEKTVDELLDILANDEHCPSIRNNRTLEEFEIVTRTLAESWTKATAEEWSNQPAHNAK